MPSVDWTPNPHLWQHLHSFDVNRTETNSYPSWIFAVLYARLDKLSSLSKLPKPAFAMHAGESWVSPLDGLRRIGEATLFPEVSKPVRIGHGLALDSRITAYCSDCWTESLSDTPISDFIFDWVWLAHLNIVPISNPLEWDKLCEASLADLVNEYRNLYKLETYLDRQWLNPEVLFLSPIHQELAGADSRPLSQVVTRKTIEKLSFEIMQVFPTAQEAVITSVKEAGMVVECCPTSNVWIGRVPWYTDHPFYRFAHKGIRVTINTDNPGFFETNISEEEELLLKSLSAANPRIDIANAISDARILGLKLTAEHVEKAVDWQHIKAHASQSTAARDGGSVSLQASARSVRDFTG